MDRLSLNAPSSEALAEQRKRDVERLYKDGHKQTEIADILGITQARVSQIMADITRNRTNKRRMLRMHPPEPARP